jgi:hypothetical protein
MWAFAGIAGAARSGGSSSFVPVSGAPDALRRPMTASWSPRLSRSHASMSILMRRATT